MLVPCLGVWPLVPILDFKPVHMCWEQLPVREWADCALIVYLAIADDPGVGTMLSILSLVLKEEGCSQVEKEWIAIPPAAEKVGEGG